MLRFLTFIIISLFLSGCNESYSDKYHSNSTGNSSSTGNSNSTGVVENWLKLTLGLSSKDACKIMENHAGEAQDIYKNSKSNLLLFQNMLPFSDSYFQSANLGTPPPGYILEDWDSAQKIHVREKFARMIFLLNTSKFKQVYESISINIEPQSSIVSGVTIPHTIEEFRRHINDYAIRYNGLFKVFVSETRTGVAWGAGRSNYFC